MKRLPGKSQEYEPRFRRLLYVLKCYLSRNDPNSNVKIIPSKKKKRMKDRRSTDRSLIDRMRERRWRYLDQFQSLLSSIQRAGFINIQKAAGEPSNPLQRNPKNEVEGRQIDLPYASFHDLEADRVAGCTSGSTPISHFSTCPRFFFFPFLLILSFFFSFLPFSFFFLFVKLFSAFHDACKQFDAFTHGREKRR